MSESEFLRHEPCPSCGSSDANSLYSDGHSYCFSCHTYTPGEDAVEHTSNDHLSFDARITRTAA